MHPSTLHGVREVFDEALKLHPGERAAYLDRLEPSLRREVERLLLADSEAIDRGFLDNPLLEWGTENQIPHLPFRAEDEDKYRLIRRIPGGGMAIVYEAVALNPDRRVAIKVMQFAADGEQPFQEALRRFQDEQQILATLDDHPNVVGFIASGVLADGRPYFVMKYVDGQALDARLAAGPLTADQTAAITSQIAKALAFAHQAGVIHRDIKPSNIMLAELAGELHVKVLDFGIAVIKSSLDEVTRDFSRHIVCTPVYASPEQAEGKSRHEIDRRSDIYSLGLVVYEMMTGKKAFDGLNELQVLNKRLAENPIPPSRRRPDLNIPDAADRAVMKAIERNRDRRYSDVLAFAKDIETALSEPVLNPEPEPAARPKRLLLLAAMLLLAIGAAAELIFLKGSSTMTPPITPDAGSLSPQPVSGGHDAPRDDGNRNAAAGPQETSGNSNSQAASSSPRPGGRVDFRLNVFRQTRDGSKAVALDQRLQEFHNGDNIRLSFTAPRAGYVYLLQRGSSGKTSILYPSSATDQSISKGETFQFPRGTGYWIHFDNNPGPETLYVVFARRRGDPLVAPIETAIANGSRSLDTGAGVALISQLEARADSPESDLCVKVLRLRHR